MGQPEPSLVPHGPHAFLRGLGVNELPARTSAFDPGYDAGTVINHLEQSGRLLSRLGHLSMATWLLADEEAMRAKIRAAKRMRVPLVTGGGPFEIAKERGSLAEYFALCAELGIERIGKAGGAHPADAARRRHQPGAEVWAGGPG